MCIVSNIGDYYGKRYPHWPEIDPWQTKPIQPYEPQPMIPYPPREDPKEIAERMRKFMDLVKKGEEADKAMGEKDCERGEVKEFIKKVGDRLDAIEKRLRQLEGLE